MFLQLILILVVLIPLLAIQLDSQVGKALASRLEKGGGGGSTDTKERITFLESEVERLAGEVHRLDEEGEFMQQLLSAVKQKRAEQEEDSETVPPPGDDSV